MSTLTPKQHEIVTYLKQRQNNALPVPTLPTICADLGLKSRGSMHKHIQALVDEGLVEPMNGLRRGVCLIEQPQDNLCELPFLGKIAAGMPLHAIPDMRTLEIPAVMRPSGDSYILEVSGDSMIDAGIHDGDMVVIERCNEARNGEIIVALIDHSEVTLKKIEQSDEHIKLIPQNRTMKPMLFAHHRVKIQGRLSALLRTY